MRQLPHFVGNARPAICNDDCQETRRFCRRRLFDSEKIKARKRFSGFGISTIGGEIQMIIEDPMCNVRVFILGWLHVEDTSTLTRKNFVSHEPSNEFFLANLMHLLMAFCGKCLFELSDWSTFTFLEFSCALWITRWRVLNPCERVKSLKPRHRT